MCCKVVRVDCNGPFHQFDRFLGVLCFIGDGKIIESLPIIRVERDSIRESVSCSSHLSECAVSGAEVVVAGFGVTLLALEFVDQIPVNIRRLADALGGAFLLFLAQDRQNRLVGSAPKRHVVFLV